MRAKGDQLEKDWLTEKTGWLEPAGFMGKTRLQSRDFWQDNNLGAFSGRPDEVADLESMNM